jgi:hypothetical protein
MKNMHSVGAFVLAAACAASAAWAQAGGGGMSPAAPASAPGAAAASAATPPMPVPNPALDQLKYFAGNWQCAGTGYVAGKAHPTSARVHLGWDLNGFFMSLRYEEQKTAVNPMPVTAVEHWGYSDELKKLVAGFVDSMGGYGTHASAGWEGDKLVWLGDTHMMGMKMPSRDTFVKRGENEVTHLGELLENGAWVKQDEETCYRLASK